MHFKPFWQKLAPDVLYYYYMFHQTELCMGNYQFVSEVLCFAIIDRYFFYMSWICFDLRTNSSDFNVNSVLHLLIFIL